MKTSNPFPPKIGKFQFLKIVDEFGQKSSYKFAYYKWKDTKYVCKLWQGRITDIKRKWIINEIKGYSQIHQAIKSSPKPNASANIIFPNIYTHYVSEKLVWFLMDEVKGKPLSTRPTKKIIESYHKIWVHLSLLSKHLNPEDVLVQRRNLFALIFLFHYYLLYTVVKYPRILPLLLKTIPSVYTGFIALGSFKPKTLVLRDLASTSIFFEKDNLYLIDLEHLAITYPIMQIAQCINAEANNRSFFDQFCNSKPFLDSISNSKQLKAFKALVINGVVVDIAAARVISDKSELQSEAKFLIEKALAL